MCYTVVSTQSIP